MLCALSLCQVPEVRAVLWAGSKVLGIVPQAVHERPCLRGHKLDVAVARSMCSC